MRPRVPWMNEVDDAILEFYSDIDECLPSRISLPPTAVWYNLVVRIETIDRASNTISRRMQILESMGLLERPDEDRPYYNITKMGEEYLAGELDSEELERPDEYFD